MIDNITGFLRKLTELAVALLALAGLMQLKAR